MAYKALYRTYRPDGFDQMAGQKHIVKTLENAIANNRIAHAYLFCGPRGTGKTSTAKIFAKAINCTGDKKPCGTCDNCKSSIETTHPDIVEIDAASNNGVEEARSLIEKVKYAPILGKYKVYIIDEVHMMSTGAFNALLKTIEEPPAHVIFILATTEPHKVIATIVSRCQRFDFTKIGRAEIVDKLKYVVAQENMKVEDRALENIAILADGGLRDALSILDQCRAYSPDNITQQDVNEIYGVVSVQEICALIELIKKKDTKQLIQTIESFDKNGTDIKRLTTDIIELLKESVIHDYAKDEAMLNLLTLEEVRALKLDILTTKRLEMIDLLMDSFERYRYSSNVVSYFEIAMLKAMDLLEGDRVISENKTIEEPKKNVIPIKTVEITPESNTPPMPTNNEEIQVAYSGVPVVEETVHEKISESLIIENEVGSLTPPTPIMGEKESVDNEPYIAHQGYEEDFVETIEEVVQAAVEEEVPSVVSKPMKALNMEFVLSLLVGANKAEKIKDIEMMRQVNSFLFDMDHGKFANLLKNKTMIASAQEYIVFSVDSEIVANEINDLDKNEEFLSFTNELLKKKKKVFAITGAYAKEVIEEFKARSASNTLPAAPSVEIKEDIIEEKDEKMEKITSYFGDVEIKED